MNAVTGSILAFYEKDKRILPWRSHPTPYHVLVSEIMLQQTRVDTVIPYYERFLHALPDIQALAEASEDILNKLWQGLGYYSRVRNLQKAAIVICDNYQGEIPSTYAELLKLPGIGPYTAGAILSIAFNQVHVAVDGNVLRVFSRFYGIRDDIKSESTVKFIESKVRDLYPEDRASDFTQALMEIGAIICLPNGEPLCEQCPLKEWCQASLYHLQNEIPKKTLKKEKPMEKKTVLILKYKDRIAIHKRSSKGLLASLYELPNLEGHFSESDIYAYLSNEGFEITSITPSRKYRHVFTHKIWQMTSYIIELKGISNRMEWIFKSKEEIAQFYSIPTAFLPFIDNQDEAILPVFR